MRRPGNCPVGTSHATTVACATGFSQDLVIAKAGSFSVVVRQKTDNLPLLASISHNLRRYYTCSTTTGPWRNTRNIITRRQLLAHLSRDNGQLPGTATSAILPAR